MIHPSAIDVLRAIEETHEKVIRPALTRTFELSAAATMSHLLRHVALRIEVEGQILADDIAAARRLLGEIDAYLATLDPPATAPLRDAIGAVVARRFRADGAYPTLTSMAEEAGAFRRAVTDALAYLQSIRAAQGGDPDYRRVRDGIRAYIAEQIRREAELIEPAFADRGPRR